MLNIAFQLHRVSLENLFSYLWVQRYVFSLKSLCIRMYKYQILEINHTLLNVFLTQNWASSSIANVSKRFQMNASGLINCCLLAPPNLLSGADDRYHFYTMIILLRRKALSIRMFDIWIKHLNFNSYYLRIFSSLNCGI